MKIVRFFFMLLPLILLLLSCSDIYSKKGNVVYTTYSASTRITQYEDSIFPRFKKQYPKIEITRKKQEPQKVLFEAPSFLKSTKGAGIISFRNEKMLFTISQSNLIMELSDVWHRENWAKTLLPAFQNPNPLTEKHYFLPVSWEWYGIFYRPSVFETHNIKEPKNWIEFLTICKTLKKAGLTPLAIGTRYNWPASQWFDYLTLRMHGSTYYKKLISGAASFHSEEIQNVFQIWKQLIRKGYFISDSDTYSWEGSIKQTAEKQAAMVLSSSAIQKYWPYQHRNDLSFFAFPDMQRTPDINPGEIIPMNGYVISASVINASTEDAGAARRVLAYLGSKEAQTERVRSTGNLPTRKDVPTSRLSDMQKKALPIATETQQGFPPFMRTFPRSFSDKALRLFADFVKDPDNIPIPELTRTLQEYYTQESSE